MDAEQVPEQGVNVIFNSGDGQQTEDLLDVTESSSFTQGQWQAWNPSGNQAQGEVRLSVIGGSTSDGGRDFPVGSRVRISADEAPLGTEFAGWMGDGAAYLLGDPSQPSVDILMPRSNVTVQALFSGQDDEFALGRDFYEAQCASCHASDGSGGVGPALDNLDDTWNMNLLTGFIADFMPVDNTSLCAGSTAGSCAYETARLIDAGAWDNSACTGADCEGGAIDKRNLRLLTRREYLNSVRDIFNINFSDALMDTVPTDGRFRNFTTASFLTSGNERTLGYQMVAREVAEQAITRHGFTGLAEGCTEALCVIDELGERLFRRPLSLSEVDNYLQAYSDADGGRSALQALLMSPHFMYRSELGALDPQTDLYRLDSYEIVTALAYTFWVTTPDQALMSAAEEADNGGNLNLDQLAEQVLNDPRAERGLRRFVSGWLINNQFPFPGIDDPALVSDLKEETVGFVLQNIQSNAAFRELLKAEYSYANQRVAQHYGMPDNGESGWTQRPYAQDDARSGAGLLGHSSFLASRTNTINPSPIKRGVFVREVFMCQEFPPPAAANFDVVFEPTDSNREATARHTSDPACAACHQFIDGVGFGFENFDSRGLFRAMETLGNGEQQEIDASGSIKSLDSPETVLDPNSEAVAYHSVPELASLIAQSGQGEACFSRQFYRYVVGREADEVSDNLIIRNYSQGLRNGGGMKDMLKALILSDSFIQRR